MNRHHWRPASITYNEPVAESMFALGVTPDEWIAHVAGQYCEIRLPDGDVSRAFSIVSGPIPAGTLEFGIRVLEYGLLTPRLTALSPGDRIEIRGPLGAGFPWSPSGDRPLLLLAGGAGITPLLSMLSAHRSSGSAAPVRLVVSARRPERVYRYRTIANDISPRFTEREPRIDRTFLAEHLREIGAFGDPARVDARVCGPSRFMVDMVGGLLSLGLRPDRIRSEAFV
jgi:ferredoxin-NADP reductase